MDSTGTAARTAHSADSTSSESDRLAELYAVAVLDTEYESVYDDLTHLACEVCAAPIGAISLVESERTWFKSRVGFLAPEVKRCDSFCSQVIEQSAHLVVEDAQAHSYYKDNIYVLPEGGVRAYAGYPLTTVGGHTVGVLCVMDRVPRPFTEQQLGSLARLASQVVVLLEQRRSNLRLAELSRRYQLLYENSPSAILQTATTGEVLFANPAACALFGLTEEQLRLRHRGELVSQADPRLTDLLAQRAQCGSAYGQLTMVKGDGSEFEAEISSNVYVDQDGMARTSLILSDISEKARLLQLEREQHARLKEVEAQHRALLQHLGSGIVVHAPDTHILFSNTRASELLGLTVEQMDGKMAIDPAWHFVYEDGSAIPVSEYPVNKVITTLASTSEMILGVRRPDRVDVVWLLGHAFPEFDNQGGLKHVVVNFHDITQRKNAETQTWTEANFDHLTRLPNRRLFHDRLEQKLHQSLRDHSTAALMFLDLDHFKDVNDSQGHDMGDMLLVEVAQRIKDCVRESDTIARLGGDEFTIILSDLQHDHNVAQVAAKIIQALSKPYLLGRQETFLSASMGIAMFPDDGANSSELLKHADQALYVAKNEGRSCFRFFTSSMQEAAVARMQLTSDLRHALRDHQFELFYQPIVDLVTGDISKAEALIRWRHPVRGLVSPGAFIPIAEESGAIHEMGNWVFHEAARQVARLCTFKPNFQISINKSPVQFSGEDDVCSQWIAHLKQLHLPGSSIVIEITEGLLMNSSATVIDRLLRFRDAGIQVAIDDFGTGYSSLSYLKKFDIDFLKIDQSFTRNLTAVAPDLAVCEAIVVMAHKLGFKVIAEGVETQEQLDLLRHIGCDYAQGYLFARPMPVAEFEDFLKITSTPPPRNVLKRNNVKVSGAGPVLLYAHGFGCGQNMWNRVTPAFASTHQQIVFDYVGSGQSDMAAFDAKKYASLNGYVQDVLDICDALNLTSGVTFIGHSVSCSVGLLASLARPQLFSQLVLLGPNPCFINHPPAYTGGFEKEDLEGLLALMDQNYIGWANYLAPVLTAAGASSAVTAVTAELTDSFCSTDPVAAKVFAKTTFFADNRADLPLVRVPSLILQHRDDSLAPTSVGEYMHSHLHNSTLQIIDIQGHCAHMSEPQVVVDAMKEYFQKSRLQE